MATIVSSPEQRVVLENMTWDLYERLLEAHRDCSVPRFTYDRGRLEIMSPSAEHEHIKETVALLINIVAEEMGINAEGFGSTTFRRRDLDRGFEPDACFYMANLAQMKGKRELDLEIDPPPDMVVEIDITRSSLDKLSVFAHLGIPEVWRYDGERMRIMILVGTGYVEAEQSVMFPGVTGERVSGFLEASRFEERLSWLRSVRAWVRGFGV
ncbi:Uma2 family endonuclease [Candidatus Entotheonella palauensis]|uniref:Uma2 family endonuclease n=1 Tax=Candidatus Entotheonella palauensis TaxID=93172 RepID=UPI000B7FF067|nr:Uma2 family endonuclease [Candidatus Entotheonella palauensis]